VYNEGYGVGILGVGKYLPGKIINSEDIEKKANLTPGEIKVKTGVVTRHIVEEHEKASEMSAAAAKDAMEMASITPEEIGVILGCTSTADYMYPAMACKVHDLLGAKNAAAYDIKANCTAFTVGLGMMNDKMLCDPNISYSVVIGTAIQSRYTNWEDPNTAIYFGDGVGAAVLGKVPKGYGVLACETFTNSRVYEAVRLRGGGSNHPMRAENINKGLQYQEIGGMEVWKQVIQNQPKVIKSALERIEKTSEDVDFFIFHQASLPLIEFLMGKMKIPAHKTYINVDRVGNTAEASIPLALCEAVYEGRIKRDDLIVLSGVGAGFTFGATILRWY
jgi:3-oxoacyl-[acyl-carrier-protein] synthase-3